MKKALLFLLIPFLGFSQWTENFDSGTTMPSGWAVINNGDVANTWLFGAPYTSGTAQSGTNVATIHWGATAHDDYLITKAITVQAGISDRISFYVKSESSSSFLENYSVLLSTTDQTVGSFTTTLQATQKAPGTWTKLSFNLSSYIGQTVYVAVRATDTDQFFLYADSFVVDALPSCIEPSSLSTNTITTTSANISWVAPTPAPANGYQIYYSTSNVAPTSTTTPNLSVSSATVSSPLSPLASGTVYYVWVRSNCGSGFSDWSSVSTFTTLLSNDNCSGAIAITPGAAFTQNPIVGTNFNATLTTDATATHDCQTTGYKDVWYSVVVPPSGNITIETQSVSGSAVTDTVLGVYSGTCGALTQIGCNDDDSSDGNFSLVSLTGQVPGSTLLIGVWNYSSSSVGQFKIAAYDASLSTSDAALIKKNLKAYPNPFTDTLNISDVKNVKSISIVDIAGRVVKTIEKPSSSLQLRELNSGMYMVVLNMNDGSRQTIKAIKK